jgi:signal transduction histidine kinase
MKDFLSIIFSYVKKHTYVLVAFSICSLIFAVIFSLYDLPVEAVTYAIQLSFFALVIIAFLRIFSYYKKHKELKHLKNVITVSLPKFPEASDKIENDYQGLLILLHDSKLSVIYEKDNSFSNMMDYYTMWAHQIKTPIAAMRLILQSEEKESNDELLEQLFRTEQYVEMVLQYLRMESDSSDLLIKRYSLDMIVKQAVKKYAKSFIRQKIKLNYEDLNVGVITDEKWLCFVLEQLLSNALKYTHSGSISIYMDEAMPEALVIEDTGIGIQEEDIPRVFEKGFTGYNGRADKKSTGIGLFLCKKILKKLSHTISIESTLGKGTKVKVGLDMLDFEIE